jgi:hypothetical protein
MWLHHTTANENGPNGSAANDYFQSSYPEMKLSAWSGISQTPSSVTL